MLLAPWLVVVGRVVVTGGGVGVSRVYTCECDCMVGEAQVS